MSARRTYPERLAEIARIAGGVADPEIPEVSIADLGILRGVQTGADGQVEVLITPTYSGCPAIDSIEDDVGAALARAGWMKVRVRRVLSPAWTSDWITEQGRKHLRAAGIAPPSRVSCGSSLWSKLSVHCPRCGSQDTEQISPFSSTACRSLRRCRDCQEPFELFKTI